MPIDIHALIDDASASMFSRDHIPFDSNKSWILNQHERLQVESGSNSPKVAPHVLEKENLTKALDRSKKRNASALGTPKVF